MRYAYIIRCEDVIKDEQGEILEVRCTYDPETKSGAGQAARKVKGTIHWVSVAHALEAEVRLFDHLFSDPDPEKDGRDYRTVLNPDSVERLQGCRVEPALQGAVIGQRFQFERQGYFCVDPDSTGQRLVFNRTVALRDSWAKLEKK